MMNFPPCILHQASEHVWWFTPEERTDLPSLGIVVGKQETLMLDIGASPAHTQAFLQALEHAGLPPPDSAILTHWHWDHSFGIDALSIPIATHYETANHLKRMAGYDYSDAGLDALVKQGIEIEFVREYMPIELDEEQRRNLKLRHPDFIFDTTRHYDLGDVSCEVRHVGGDHASDSCVIYIPEDKVLFMSDCLYATVYEQPRHYTNKVLELITQLESFDAQLYIEGHINQVMPLREIKRRFAIIKQAFRLIEQYGIANEALLLSELINVFGKEDVLDYLNLIVEGYKLRKSS